MPILSGFSRSITPLWLRRMLGVLAWSALALYFAIGLTVLALRYLVLPNVDSYRGDIERSLSTALGQPVTIGALDARWNALWPRVRVHDLAILDIQGRPALAFKELEADIAWSSVWHLAPHFARLEINAPSLNLRRETDGRFFVAGIEIKRSATPDSGFADWLLAQDSIVIRDASIIWNDALRKAPELALTHVNFQLDNQGSRHRFGLTAEPPRELAARLDLRGDFHLGSIDALAAASGKAYVELDYADLAGWQTWVDYPVEVVRGYGGLRLWFDLERDSVMAVTADVRLSRTITRLASDLPKLDMEFVDGRIVARRERDGFALQTQRLFLATYDGARLEPADIAFSWRQEESSGIGWGAASANVLDLGTLAVLAKYFPFDAALRKKLIAWNPRGRVRDLQFGWTETPATLSAYLIRTRFENLSLNAQGLPLGFSGLTGTIEADERGGELNLDMGAATLVLPQVFEQPSIALASLKANAGWTVRDGVVDVQLQNAKFENADVAGDASGRYRYGGKGAGEIDLSAKLTRADGRAVWRYMPLAINADVRAWLKESIRNAQTNATLRLKGNLDHFPFADGSGIFEVKAPLRKATLRYDPDWPAIENINGDLLISGPRLLVGVQQASTGGVQLADVKAEIADLGKPQPLIVTGTARGQASEFLSFIATSPISGYIGNATEGMQINGNGELRLRLDLPLENLDATKVDGRFRFLNNRLSYDAELPPISDITGELHFTEQGLTANKIRAAMLGGPLTVDIKTVDGQITILANGTVQAAALRQQFALPLLDHLTGAATWHGSIQTKKDSLELQFKSSLTGISSRLPEPFNKTANETMPLVFELKPRPESATRIRRMLVNRTPGAREQWDFSLGNVLRGQIIRRYAEGAAVIDRGLLTVGDANAELPRRGVLLAIKTPRVDIDAWQQIIGGGNGSAGGGSSIAGIDQIDLRIDELRGFGRALHALQLSGRHEGETWKLNLNCAEATGHADWTSSADGDRFSVRLARLNIPDASGPRPAAAVAADPAQRLPAIDLIIDRLQWQGRELGRLQAHAGNAQGIWGARFEFHNEDGNVEGTSSWVEPRDSTPGASALDFRLTANNVEKLLTRFGYPDAIRQGDAKLAGSLYWQGPPTGIDYSSLGGGLSLEANHGQFKTLEPGVGRLLGVLSLQSLPRRITLDFRDVFSEGFAFDTIKGKAVIMGGVMNTREFEITGPAAKVLLDGTANIADETQDLKVRVQPTLGETIATGMVVVNPIFGVAIWLLDKVLGNPLDKAFAFNYAITGSWAEPKVEKITAPAPEAPPDSPQPTP